MTLAMHVSLCALFVMVEGLHDHKRGAPEDRLHWAPHTPQAANHYCEHVNTFCNKCDFPSANEIMKSFFEHRTRVTLFIVGLNDGKDLVNVLGQSWYRSDKAHIYAWEIMDNTYAKAVKKFKGHPEVVISRGAVSASEGDIVNISGSGETAGIYEPGAHGGRFEDAGEQVRTLRWDNFVGGRRILEVSYAIIDVEGHEMGVIAGMELGRLRDTFPVFQYELGGTWVDERHEGNMTQADAAEHFGYDAREAHTHLQALHMAAAQRLTGMGYRIYLMGHENGVPMLSPVTPKVFLDAKCVQENGRYFIQGNALAVLETAADQMPWLTNAIDVMVANDAALR
jgi:FkbM family methyltransferase